MNNKFDKFKRFIKKEGFYVILFVCLCSVATVAVVTSTKAKKDMENEKVVVQDTDKKVVEQPKNPDGALQVKEDLKEVPNVKGNNDTKAVSNSNDKSFINPVDGSLGRAYSEDPVYWATTKSYKTHLGMDIKAKEGASVKSVSEGIVKNVGKNTEGAFVEIDHQNGLVTVYGNLEENILVKKGDKVTASQEIAKVGNTTNFAYEEYGTHLHFQVFKDGNEVDPAKYVSYKK